MHYRLTSALAARGRIYASYGRRRGAAQPMRDCSCQYCVHLRKDRQWYVLDSQTHARPSREGNKPVVQLSRFKPAFGLESVRLREEGCVVVNKRTAARDNRLEPQLATSNGNPRLEPTYICRYSNAVDGCTCQWHCAQETGHHTGRHSQRFLDDSVEIRQAF